ncbi:hypothetical protein [Shewanella sp.]|uniref:hypothetical protein n=1 Tax=Shewanella sp. TaxID=50422 RepID=UPI004048193A
MTNKRCPQGSAKNVLLFVEQCFTNKELLRWLGFNPFASIKTFLTRTKFNQQRSTGPSKKRTAAKMGGLNAVDLWRASCTDLNTYLVVI